jgi:predicted transcriptional regulator
VSFTIFKENLMDLTNLCTREVVGIDAQASLRDAAALMCDEHVGSLVVLRARNLPKCPAFGTTALE